jgi:pyruvate ferredoxin oxidoreductase delta subunit
MNKYSDTHKQSWKELTPGGTIYDAANSEEFKTADWRSMKPKYIKEKCTQCGLCPPTCPDSAIPVVEGGKRTDFNYDYCKGCGVCAKVCPFGAIVMEENK